MDDGDFADLYAAGLETSWAAFPVLPNGLGHVVRDQITGGIDNADRRTGPVTGLAA